MIYIAKTRKSKNNTENITDLIALALTVDVIIATTSNLLFQYNYNTSILNESLIPIQYTSQLPADTSIAAIVSIGLLIVFYLCIKALDTYAPYIPKEGKIAKLQIALLIIDLLASVIILILPQLTYQLLFNPRLYGMFCLMVLINFTVPILCLILVAMTVWWYYFDKPSR